MFTGRDRHRLENIEPRLERLEKKFDIITVLLMQIKEQGVKEMAVAQQVLDAVQAESTVVDSVLALLKQVQQDPAILDQVIAGIESDKSKMNAVLVAGTPAAGTPMRA